MSGNAMSGRRPLPTQLKVLRGNPGKRALNGDEPRHADASIVPPEYLSEYAREEWQRLAPQLSRLGMLTVADVSTFAALCEAVANFRSASEELQEHGGHTLTTEKGMIRHPASIVQRDAQIQMRGFSSLFGLSPSDRTRLVTTEKPDADDGEALLA